MEHPLRPSSSSVSLTDSLLDDQDEDVRIAVRALGDMKNSRNSMLPTPALSIASSSSAPTTSIPSPTLSSTEVPHHESPSESDFVTRVSHIPLVNGALRMYEQSKASSRVVKYGAEIMESSVKTISRPVIERLPVNTVGQLDEFACRQLDRLQYGRPTSTSGSSPLSPRSPGGRGRGRFFEQRPGGGGDVDMDMDTHMRHSISGERDSVSPRGEGYERERERERERVGVCRDGWREDETKVGSWLNATSPHMSHPSASSSTNASGSGSRRSPVDTRSRSRSLTPTPGTDVYHPPTGGRVYHEYEYEYGEPSSSAGTSATGLGPSTSRSQLGRRDYSSHDRDVQENQRQRQYQYRSEAEVEAVSAGVGVGVGVGVDGADRDRDHDQQVVHRSRMATVLSEFGGFAGALSEESMKKLRYCLQWLQYATNHIDAQILVLRDFTASIQQQYFDDPSLSPSSPTTPTSTSTATAPSTSTSTSTSTPDSESKSKTQKTRTRSGTSPTSRTHTHTRSNHSRSNSSSEAISEAHLHKLTDIQRDVVKTVKEVVSVVSKYGGGASLPDPAKKAMKGFILKLPQRWAEAVRGAPTGVPTGVPGGSGGSTDRDRESVVVAASGRAGSSRRTGRNRGKERGVGSTSAAASPVSSRATSPCASPKVHSRVLHSGVGDAHAHALGVGMGRSPTTTMSAGAAFVTAQRILALATESLDMMRNVTGVVMDSLDRADAWVERLRIVGIQRGEGDEGRFMEYREDDRERFSHSRTGSGSGGEFSIPNSNSGSSPGSPYISSTRSSSLMNLPPVYAPASASAAVPVDVDVDASSPGVGLGLRRMSIAEEERRSGGVKKEEEMDEFDLRVPMDVDG